MTVQALLVLVGVIATAAATFWGTRYAARREAEASPYSTLAERVTRLETQVAQLLIDQYTDRAHIRSLWDYGATLPGWAPPLARPLWMTSPGTDQ